jgi:hypothetical protein
LIEDDTRCKHSERNNEITPTTTNNERSKEKERKNSKRKYGGIQGERRGERVIALIRC